MAQYLAKAQELLKKLNEVKLYHIKRDSNAHTDALATLAVTLNLG